MTIIKKKQLLETIQLLVLDMNSWNHTTVCKLFQLNWNSWTHTIIFIKPEYFLLDICKLFVLRRVT